MRRGRLEDLDLNGRLILKRILNKKSVIMWRTGIRGQDTANFRTDARWCGGKRRPCLDSGDSYRGGSFTLFPVCSFRPSSSSLSPFCREGNKVPRCWFSRLKSWFISLSQAELTEVWVMRHKPQGSSSVTLWSLPLLNFLFTRLRTRSLFLQITYWSGIQNVKQTVWSSLFAKH
jgi:hypothetical protein